MTPVDQPSAVRLGRLLISTGVSCPATGSNHGFSEWHLERYSRDWRGELRPRGLFSFSRVSPGVQSTIR
jgi:hypothetical protein